jgi:two-component system phosphate regulon sensor histidine kinase PhoR
LAAALAALLAFVVAEITARPVRRLTQMAGQMSGGDLDTRLLPTTRDEVGALAHAFNQMAERLQGTVDALRSERSRMVGVMEHMADGVLITDGKGCVQLANPAALRLLGVDREKVVGHRFTEATHDYRLIGLWQQCHEQRREQIEMVELAHGPFLRAIVSPLRDAEEGTCLFVLQDLTEVRRAETARRDFVSNASHELRTPLAALRALVETLRDGALEDPPAARHFLERMDIEVDALTQMVEELLALSRIESGRAELEMRPHAVRDVIVPPVERLRPQAERARVTLTVELPPDLPPVRADLDHVRQVVTNLVHNSIKFTPAGGQVVVRAVVEKDAPPHLPIPASPCLIISVSDTGAGIAADDLPRIFERFFKADRARSGGGTGLGLAIARHIVRAHGGSIWAESVEERGSTFTFTLPLAKP